MRIARIWLACACFVACGRVRPANRRHQPNRTQRPARRRSAPSITRRWARATSIGYGSSRPCVLYDDCDGTGYVWVAARSLRSQGFTVNVQQLGIPGAVISRTFQDLAIQYGRNDVLANFIQQEMPFVKREASLVTVFTGANDVNIITAALGKGAGGAIRPRFIDQMVAGVHQRFRHADRRHPRARPSRPGSSC